MFSGEMDGIPQLFVQLKMDDPTREANFVIAHGTRPYAHYWDDPSANRTPVPFFTLRSELCLQKMSMF